MGFVMFGFHFETTDRALLFGFIKQIFFTIDTVFVLDVILLIAVFTHYRSRRSLLYLFWHFPQSSLTNLAMSHKFWVFKSAAGTHVIGWLFFHCFLHFFGHAVGARKHVFPHLLMAVFTDPSTIVHLCL